MLWKDKGLLSQLTVGGKFLNLILFTFLESISYIFLCTFSEGKKICKQWKINKPEPTVIKHYKDGEFHKDYDRKERYSNWNIEINAALGCSKGVKLCINIFSILFLVLPLLLLLWRTQLVMHLGKKMIQLRMLFTFNHLKLWQNSCRKKRNLLCTFTVYTTYLFIVNLNFFFPSFFRIMFYAPWCGYCKKMKPDYSSAATELKGQAILVAIDVNRPENAVIRYLTIISSKYILVIQTYLYLLFIWHQSNMFVNLHCLCIFRKHYNITGFPTLLYFE